MGCSNSRPENSRINAGNAPPSPGPEAKRQTDRRPSVAPKIDLGLGTETSLTTSPVEALYEAGKQKFESNEYELAMVEFQMCLEIVLKERQASNPKGTKRPSSELHPDLAAAINTRAGRRRSSLSGLVSGILTSTEGQTALDLEQRSGYRNLDEYLTVCKLHIERSRRLAEVQGSSSSFRDETNYPSHHDHLSGRSETSSHAGSSPDPLRSSDGWRLEGSTMQSFPGRENSVPGRSRTGRRRSSASMMDDDPCDIFLSYRKVSDLDVTEKLYDKLTAMGLKVWWDRKCLPAGMPFEKGIPAGLISCHTFVPVLSRGALAPLAEISSADAARDYVLAEYALALELNARSSALGTAEEPPMLAREYERGAKQRTPCVRILPVLLGDVVNLSAETSGNSGLTGEMYSNFFQSGALPACHDVVLSSVTSFVEDALSHYDRQQALVLNNAASTPQLPSAGGPAPSVQTGRVRSEHSMSVRGVLARIIGFQGHVVEGFKHDAIDKVASGLRALFPEEADSFVKEDHGGPPEVAPEEQHV